MNLFERIYDYENLQKAYSIARQNERYRLEALQFGALLEENIINIQNHLIWRSYVSGAMGLPLIDRIVEQSLVNVIAPIFGGAHGKSLLIDLDALKLIRREIKCEGTLWLINNITNGLEKGC